MNDKTSWWITMMILLTPVIGGLYFLFAISFDKPFREGCFALQMMFWSAYQGICIGALTTFILLL